ncbi:MAG: MMPL family transporter [Pseudomonadales bacterium]|jgi:predicted RND superfamily exporter protein|nr:MMPL family transporter [Pseudomonadales bacterium]
MSSAGASKGAWYLVGVRRPRLVLAVAAALLLALASGAPQLSFDPRYGTFFDPEDPQLRAFEHLRSVFAPSDAVVFVVDTGDAGVFSAVGLAALERLTEEAWRLPFATRVDSLVNHPHSAADGELVTIAPLVEDADRLDDADRARLRQTALGTPEIARRLVAEDDRYAAVAVTVLLEGDPLASTQALIDAARALAAAIEADAPLRVHVGGIVAMNHAFAESSLIDSASLVPLMLGLVLLGLRLLLASTARTVAVLLVMISAVLAALGAAGWAGMVLTTPTAMAPIIILTIGVANGVHVVLGQYVRADAESVGRARRLGASLEENALPLSLTTATSAAGFLSMNFSAVPPFRDLGNLVALGVIFAGVLSLTALPALLALLPDGKRPPRLSSSSFRRAAAFLLERRRALATGLLVAFLLVLPGLLRLEVNDDFVAYFDPSLPFRSAAELTDAHLGGMYEIEQQLTATEGSIHDPRFLAEIEAYTTWLRAQPETGHVLAWSDVLARLHRTLCDSDCTGSLPSDAELAAQYTLLFELSLPLGLDITNMIAPDYGSVRQLVALRDMDARHVIEFEARSGAWLAEHAPHVMERRGGINLMFSHISERNVRAMVIGNLLAVLVIAAMLAVALRSLALAAASLATNLVPIAAAFGLWGWAGGDVGLALSATFGMTLGIVVDDTVHLLARQHRARRAGADPLAAMEHALRSVGPALVVTTIVLGAGFAVLATSTFALNAMLARVTLLTIGLALLFDLFVLPGLLAWRDRGPGSEAIDRPIVGADDRASGRG